MEMDYCSGWKLDVAAGSIITPKAKLVSESKKAIADWGSDKSSPGLANDGFFDETVPYYAQNKVPYT